MGVDIVAKTKFQVVPTTFEYPQLCFSKKMIIGLLKGKRAAVLEDTADKPNKGSIYYIGEPFVRHYGWKDNMNTIYGITYLSDDREIFFDNCEEEDHSSRKFDASAMLPNEARFYVQITHSAHRKLSAVQLSQTAHDNLYHFHKSSNVLYVRFKVLQMHELQELERERLWDELF